MQFLLDLEACASTHRLIQRWRSIGLPAWGEGMKGLFYSSKSLSFRWVAIMATAIGAGAVGAFAIGALAIGRLKIRRVLIDRAEIKSLEIQDLTVRLLRAADVNVSDSLNLPGGNFNSKISS